MRRKRPSSLGHRSAIQIELFAEALRRCDCTRLCSGAGSGPTSVSRESLRELTAVAHYFGDVQRGRGGEQSSRRTGTRSWATAQLPTRTSVMDRSSKALQVLDSCRHSAVQSAYLSTKFHREPCLVCMERAELYAYMEGSEFKTSGLWPGQTRPRLEHGAQQFPVSSFRGCWIGIFA